MLPDLRSVLITGASTGVGYALARRLDADGWRVFAGLRTDADAQRLPIARRNGGSLTVW